MASPEPDKAAPLLSRVTASASSLSSPTRPPPHLSIPIPDRDDHPLAHPARRAGRSGSDNGKRRGSPIARSGASLSGIPSSSGTGLGSGLATPSPAPSPGLDTPRAPRISDANGQGQGFTSPDAELLGIGPSRRRREPTTTSSSRDSPSRPRPRPSSSYYALDSLGRDEVALVDARFEDMADADIAAFLAPYEKGWETYRAKRAEEEEAAARLFPPSPPGERRDHPLKILSRAVRELRESVARLEEDNARLREERDEAVDKERERERGVERDRGGSRRGSEPVNLPVVSRQTHSQQVSYVAGGS